MDLNAWNFQNEISLISDFITTGDQLGGVSGPSALPLCAAMLSRR